ncbi:MAG: acyltransferase [Thermoproteota archaeon]|nr:MAG: acyltransferase [Candidatus Korarchaeota archaeon]
MGSSKVRVGYVQFYPKFGEKERNVEKTVEMIRSAREPDVIVLPELSNTGYNFTSMDEVLKLAEPLYEGPSVREWLKAAEEQGATVIAGFAELADGGKVYNSAAVCMPDGQTAVYRKVHLFYREKLYFTPGDLGFPVFEVGKLKLGVIICYDWVFPEACRVLALRGAEVICHPANLILPYAQRAMLARSIENRVFTITANRIGVEDRGGLRLEFTGMSQVVSPKMEVLASSPRDAEDVKIAEIDLSLARDKKITELNDIFDDRRPQFYTQIVLR